MDEPRQNHGGGIKKVIEELREWSDISHNRLSSSAALATAVTDSEQMFENGAKNFDYYNKAAKYLLHRHFCAQAESLVGSEVTNKSNEKMMSCALITLLKMLYVKNKVFVNFVNALHCSITTKYCFYKVTKLPFAK